MGFESLIRLGERMRVLRHEPNYILTSHRLVFGAESLNEMEHHYEDPRSKLGRVLTQAP